MFTGQDEKLNKNKKVSKKRISNTVSLLKKVG